MIRELLILRHGKSDWDAHMDDLHRPLTDGGKRSAQRIGTWLMRQRLVPDYVISSPAVRALETARKACKAMGRSARDIIEEPGIYLASRRAMVAELEQCPEKTRRVMLVGHNPGLEDLLKYLAGSTVSVPSDDHLLHTTTLARLGMPDSWRVLRAGCANLIEVFEYLELYILILCGGLHNKIGPGHILQVHAGLNPAQNRILLIPCHFPFVYITGQNIGNVADTGLNEFFLNVAHDNIQSAHRRDLGDAVSHLPGAYHAVGFNLHGALLFFYPFFTKGANMTNMGGRVKDKI